MALNLVLLVGCWLADKQKLKFMFVEMTKTEGECGLLKIFFNLDVTCRLMLDYDAKKYFDNMVVTVINVSTKCKRLGKETPANQPASQCKAVTRGKFFSPLSGQRHNHDGLYGNKNKLEMN